MLLSSEIILYEKVPSTAHNTVKGRSFQTLLCSRNMLPSISSHSVISQDLIKLICTALSTTFLNEIGFFFFSFFFLCWFIAVKTVFTKYCQYLWFSYLVFMIRCPLPVLLHQQCKPQHWEKAGDIY